MHVHMHMHTICAYAYRQHSLKNMVNRFKRYNLCVFDYMLADINISRVSSETLAAACCRLVVHLDDQPQVSQVCVVSGLVWCFSSQSS